MASPAATGFSLASPPPLPGMNPSPAMLPHPSPGSGFLGSNSPSSAAQHGVSSPGFLVPSPAGPHSVPMHSPASAMMHGKDTQFPSSPVILGRLWQVEIMILTSFQLQKEDL